MKKLELTDIKHDIAICKNENHCITLDNYMEKYVPLVVQRIVDETLRSTFSGKERRRLELYDAEKYALLYQFLLCDDGSGNISDQMRLLHERAVIEIELEEKRRKKQMAITEAS